MHLLSSQGGFWRASGPPLVRGVLAPVRVAVLLCLVSLLSLVAGPSTAHEAADWSGSWDSRWRNGGARLILEQDGTTVTGTYPLYGGRIVAEARGRELEGQWIEAERSGGFLFIQSRDGSTFAGRFESGEWWTGLRSDATGGGHIDLDQTSPMAAMRSFLMAANAIGPGNMEMLGAAAAIIDGAATDEATVGGDRYQHARRLIEVLDQITLRLWDLSRDPADDEADFTLTEAGTKESLVIGFRHRNGEWFIVPPSIPELEEIRDRMRMARGLAPGPGLIADPARLRSPRDAMRSFLAGFAEAPDGTGRLTRATLDLRAIPEVTHDREAPLLAGYLKMVIDRIGYVIYQEIPDDPESTTAYVHFEHPNGDIVIAPLETAEGVIWQFTPETLANIRAIYAAMDDMPPASGVSGIDPPDLFFAMRTAIRGTMPHLLLPLGPLERWQWVGLGLGLVTTLTLAFVLGRAILSVGARRGLTDPGRTPIRHAVSLWALRGIMGGALLFGIVHLLGLPNTFAVAFKTLSLVLMVLGGIVLLWVAIGEVTERNRTAERIDSHNLILLSLSTGMLRLAVLIGGGLLLAHLLSLPLSGVLAGFGIGGLAVALAAQPTLQNLLAGFTLYADRPLSVGDFCRFGDKSGTVEHIGLRSTRIRTVDRTLISVPNSQFLDLQLENYAPRDRRLFETILQLRYETTPDQLRYLLAELRKILIAHPMILPEPMRVRFAGFGAHSLDVEVFAYVTTADVDEFMAAREDVLLRIMATVGEAGAQFAFPSVVEYRAEDTPPDRERTLRAEATVEEWRRSDELPFPDFEWQRKAELSNSLDYPPLGSVARNPDIR